MLALVIDSRFGEDLAAGRDGRVQAIVDGSDSNTAGIVLGYVRGVTSILDRELALAEARRAGGRLLEMPVEVRPRVWFNADLESKNFIIPGIAAVIMGLIAALLTSLTVAREWERGTMEQLAATPVHRIEVILGKLLPYLGIGLIDVIAAVVVGQLLFQVPFRGSPVLLIGLATLFLIGALGLGIFISAAVKSQLLATQTSLLATYLPSLLLSGLIFDLASMPLALRLISYLVPARYFIVVLRGIFLKGVGVGVLWVQGLAMIAFAVVGLTLAVRAFRKEIA
jgi:ABC-2 type transport system permease protein